jgi:hypothetical protein
VTKLTQLWQALERIPGLTTTIPYWKRYCGPDYAVIRPFLHATEFSGGTYPCGNADREGCFREIVYCGGNKIVAVCRQEWDPCEEVLLCSDDAVLYELDLRSFTGMIAEALGFRWQHALEDERCPWSIGLLPDGPGSDQTVFLIVETSLSNFLNSVLKVVARSQCRKVILAPTNRLKGTDVQAVLDQHRIPLYPLEEFILEREDGTLGSPNSLAELVSGKVRSKATATLGVSQANGPRGRGFEANASDHRKVAAAVLLFGEHWAAQLPQLCRELHQVGADLPTYWKEKEFVETWEEIAGEVEGDGKSSAREKVFKYIKYRIRWVREHPPDFP